MAPVAKSTHHLTLSRNERGQISIFFSASLIVLVSIVAFVINIGLFVKAKINLQNATDAAAFSGAAVQARQLSKISYLNWEMRNIYKEWMYKYYVIGNLNVSGTQNPTDAVMRFNLDPDVNVLSNVTTKDPFNIPAVCIHIAGSQTNVCKRFAVPGLPEFGGYSLPGSEEVSRSFIDALIASKVNDCAERSKLNSYVTTMWAYNVMALDANDSANSLAGRGPPILADRQGAWPRAIELAMRIRNLERAFNREPVSGGVCNRQSNTGQTNCANTIDIYTQEPKLGNERVVKAFYSGFRNLGNQTDNEMKETFTLTEIPPKGKPAGNDWDNSNLLIPSNSKYEKRWLDLKLMMVNYATFYAALIPRADSQTSGACDISKVAIPVPGYPLGFYKNPDVLTYYAVRGEAEFVGMFNPFSADSIKLTAYAAAKPFGGRVGPMLFTQKNGEQFIRGRTDNLKFRSVPYFMTLDVLGTRLRNPAQQNQEQALRLGDYFPGAPLPINFPNQEFWLTQANGPVGGKNGSNVSFGIPNLVYDFIGDLSPTSYTPAGKNLATLQTATEDAPQAGLYSSDQYNAFKGSIGGEVSTDVMEQELARIRTPTRYEMANYMIPTPTDFNVKNNIDSFGFISGQPQQVPGTNIKKYVTHVYAPLYRTNNQDDLLWGSPSEVVTTIFEFMRQQRTGILGYTHSLNKAALTIKNMQGSAAAVGAIAGYQKAAESISDYDYNLNPNDDNAFPKTCKSLAGQFLHFYYGDDLLFPGDIADKEVEPCPTTLGSMLTKYFSQSANDPNYQPTHYVMSYYLKDDQDLSIFSAYTPGPYNGVSQTGLMTPPFPNLASEMMRRNFYSTKFITLDSVQNQGGYQESRTNFVIYSEGELQTSAGFDRSQNLYENPLNPSEANLDISSIKY